MKKNNLYDKQIKLSDFGYKNYDFASCDEMLKKIIDNEISNLKRSGRSIRDCIPYLECVISKYTSERLAEIEQIHENNKLAISEWLKSREILINEYNILINDTEIKIEETKIDLDNVKKIFDEYNPLPKINNMEKK